MNLFQLVSVIGFPLLLAIGGWAARHASRREKGGFAPDSAKVTQWRDESLDAWRDRRDTELEAERQARIAVQPELQDATGSDTGETKRHQRIGG